MAALISVMTRSRLRARSLAAAVFVLGDQRSHLGLCEQLVGRLPGRPRRIPRPNRCGSPAVIEDVLLGEQDLLGRHNSLKFYKKSPRLRVLRRPRSSAFDPRTARLRGTWTVDFGNSKKNVANHAHRRTSQPDRPHLERLLVRRHLQPAGGDRADHLPAVPAPPRRPAHPGGEQGRPARSKPIERRIFPEGKDAKRRAYDDLRWSRFKNFAPAEMFTVVGEHVFPFLRTLGGDGSTYAHHMKDARFTIPTPALLAKVVDLLDDVPMEDRDTKGDLYEYMLGKIASAGQNGQFRTPRHIIQLMVEMTAPTPKDVICDPACGTCGFLVAAGEYLREHHPEILRDAEAAGALPPRHVPRLRLRQHHAAHRQHEHAAARRGEPRHPLPRLAGAGPRRRRGEVHADPRQPAVCRSPGLREHRQGPAADRQDQEDRAAVPGAVPAAAQARRPGGGDRARRRAVRLQQRRTRSCAGCWSRTRSSTRVISLPAGVFKPYAGVSTAILLFTKTNSGGTDHVWFYDVHADGWSLDDKRTPLLPEDKLGPVPRTALTDDEHAKNNLPDVLARWQQRDGDRAQAPAHRAELLRAQGRHRGAGLRPQPQPLQGSRARGGRASAAEGDLWPTSRSWRRRSSGDEGAGGDAAMSPLAA